MNEQNHDPFDILFQKAQIDLPDHLKRRLLSIPDTAPSISLWDFRRLLPIIAVVPGLFWLLIAYSTPFWQWLGVRIGAVASALPAAGSVSIPTNALYIALGVLTLSMLTATWLLLRHGHRAQISYVRQLTPGG